MQAQKGRDQQRPRRQQDLPHVHMVARDHIVKAELEGRAQERAGDQRQGGCVGPDDGHIGDDQKPGAHKAVIVAEAALGEGIGAAAAGETVHEIVVVCRQQQHDRRAEAKTKRGAHRARDRQEGVAGHDKSAPAHGTPEGQRPRAERRQVRAYPAVLMVSFFSAH